MKRLYTPKPQKPRRRFWTRALYPDSSLADLYDETLMPPKLRRAHRANDEAVMAAYGFDPKMPEQEVVARLFQM